MPSINLYTNITYQNSQNSVNKHKKQIPSFKENQNDKFSKTITVKKEGTLFRTFLEKIKIKKPETTEITITPHIEPNLVTDEQFEILADALKNKGPITAIRKKEIDIYGDKITYGVINLYNGDEIYLPNKSNILPKDKLAKKIINETESSLSLNKQASAIETMSYLYNTKIKDISVPVEQPAKPIILDKSELKTKPDDIDTFNPKLKRKDVAAIFRFGQNSLINGDKKVVVDAIKEELQKNLNKDIEKTDIRVIKGETKKDDHFVYFDKDTNITTLIGPDGTPLSQIAFNSYYLEREDEIPTDYKMYSFYDTVDKKFKKFKEN